MIFIILCGGSGTRLWPTSRSTNPKQLHSFVSSNTLLEDTILRVQKMNEMNQEPSFFYFVTNVSIVPQIQEQIYKMNLPPNSYHIVIEPIGRNSAPAILMSTLLSIQHMNENQKEPFVVVMSSDHMWDDRLFCEYIQNKNIEKYKNHILTLGIQPTSPHTGYGYIKKKQDEWNSIEEFKEKPVLEVAKEYVKSGDYLWNSGTFIYKPSTLIQVFRDYATDMLLTGYDNLLHIQSIQSHIHLLSKFHFEKFENIAFDVAIMEKITNGAVLPFTGFWSDIGSWDSIYDILPKDSNENVMKGDSIMTYQTHSSYLRNDTNKLVAVVGLENIVVVQTDDALLIMNKDKCQDIKKIIEKLPKSSPFL
jgi:mannose-1-phosphate guanylyltransferase/mannose-6-phosphate isomerase